MRPELSPTRRRPLHIAQREHAAQRGWHRIDAAMQRAATYRHPAGRIERIETHISVVYLVGRFAYKIMKRVNPGFADFTRLDVRRRCCQQELRLNRPLAPGLYLEVVPVTAKGRTFEIGGCGKVVEYAVKMKRFAEEDVFASLQESGQLGGAQVDQLAQELAAFHGRAASTLTGNRPRAAMHGSPTFVREQMANVLNALTREASTLVPTAIRLWCHQEAARLAPHFHARRTQGFVRACHGDLHLGNIVRKGRGVLMFDCIEFSEPLRWIDIASDLAFPLMDLQVHGREDLAARLLNEWLQLTGDFAALPVMRFYMVYRALVRALAACLRARHTPAAGVPDAARAYIEFARRIVQGDRPALLLCHGYSGSGKSVASAALAPLIGAVRLSSDVERKRLHRLAPPVMQPLPATAYTSQSIDAHYSALLTITRDSLLAGYPMLVDATFLKERNRTRFIALAKALAIPVFILDFHASPRTLVERVRARSAGPFDPSDAGTLVFVRQLANEEPLTPAECLITVSFDTDVPPGAFRDPRYWRPLIEQLRAERIAPQETALV